jgi:hypothetical protein
VTTKPQRLRSISGGKKSLLGESPIETKTPAGCRVLTSPEARSNSLTPFAAPGGAYTTIVLGGFSILSSTLFRTVEPMIPLKRRFVQSTPHSEVKPACKALALEVQYGQKD